MVEKGRGLIVQRRSHWMGQRDWPPFFAWLCNKKCMGAAVWALREAGVLALNDIDTLWKGGGVASRFVWCTCYSKCNCTGTNFQLLQPSSTSLLGAALSSALQREFVERKTQSKNKDSSLPQQCSGKEIDEAESIPEDTRTPSPLQTRSLTIN